MKICLNIIVILLAMLLMSCSTNDNGNAVEAKDFAVSPQLLQVDSLMWTQPDSALALLCRDTMIAPPDMPNCDSLETHSMRLYNGHYYQLLLAELRYKNYLPQANRAELRQAMAYFDNLVQQISPIPPLQRGQGGLKSPNPSSDLFFLTARAHYINGVGYYENDSVVEACREYITALETMESHFEEKERKGQKAKFLALAYTRLGELFSEQIMTEPAIECCKKSIFFNIIEATSPYGISNGYYRMGIQFDVLGQKDTALACYKQALQLLPDTNNSFYRDIASSITFLDYQINHNANKALEKLCQIKSQASDENEKNTRLLVFGSIYYMEQQYDSALSYLETVYENKNDVAVRIQVAEYLLNIYQSIGNENKINEYANFLSQYTVSNYEQKAIQSQLTNLYQDYQRKKAEIQNDMEKERQRHHFSLISTILVLFLSLVAVTIFILRQKHKKKLKATEKKLRSKEQQYVVELNDLRGINKQLQIENQKLVKQSKHTPIKAKEKEYEALLYETICMDLLHRFGTTEILTTNKPEKYASLAITSREKQTLAKIIMKHCPDFDSILRDSYPTIKVADLDICRFFLIGLSEPQIAVLLQKDYSTIWRRTKRLKEMMGFVEPKTHFKRLLFELETTE